MYRHVGTCITYMARGVGGSNAGMLTPVGRSPLFPVVGWPSACCSILRRSNPARCLHHLCMYISGAATRSIHDLGDDRCLVIGDAISINATIDGVKYHTNQRTNHRTKQDMPTHPLLFVPNLKPTVPNLKPTSPNLKPTVPNLKPNHLVLALFCCFGRLNGMHRRIYLFTHLLIRSY